MKKCTKQQKRDIRDIAARKDTEIDFSDAPPVLDWSGDEIGRFHRPRKKPVTMRLDSDVIDWLERFRLIWIHNIALLRMNTWANTPVRVKT